MDKLYLIGVGGTGMRCLEAFTHLCAIGMCDGMEVNMLSIDTDTNNGNKSRTEALVERYVRLRGGTGVKPSRNNFFSAKLNLYRFAPEYQSDRVKFASISNLNSGTEQQKRDHKALADLFFDPEVQLFDLTHGYRAQTHLGSYLMYHSFVEAAVNHRKGMARQEDKSLMSFIELISTPGKKRIFIMGSIFGGTGASSIPIIPKAIRMAAGISGFDIQDEAEYGCTLLTDYFEFKAAPETQKTAEKIVADSRNFSLNCQAALKFYDADDTILRTYRKMYHIGWPEHKNISEGKDTEKAHTGGAEQENPAHVAELFCAFAAFDFFKQNFENRRSTESGHIDQICHRSAVYQGNAFAFDFGDFAGPNYAEQFKAGLGAMLAFAHVALNWEKGGASENGVQNLVRQFQQSHINDYVNLDKEITDDLNEYLKLFAFSYDKEKVVPGWLMQIRNSVGGPFLFNHDALTSDRKQLASFEFGKLYTDEDHQFKASLASLFRSSYQTFRKAAAEYRDHHSDKGQAERLTERFTAHIYGTLHRLYRFDKN